MARIDERHWPLQLYSWVGHLAEGFEPGLRRTRRRVPGRGFSISAALVIDPRIGFGLLELVIAFINWFDERAIRRS
jgi:hypothetical protein